MTTVTSASYLPSVKPLAVTAPPPSVPKPPATKANPALPPPAPPAHCPRALSSLTPPSATGAEKNALAAAAEEDEEEEEEPDSSNYRVMPEEPQAAAIRLQVPTEAKLIGGKHIRFLGLTSNGHECKFLEEAGSSFVFPHEEEYFGNLSSADLTTSCGDLSLKAFVASWCLA
jgi:hypothetical protein